MKGEEDEPATISPLEGSNMQSEAELKATDEMIGVMQPQPNQEPNNQMVYAMQPPPTQGPNNQMVYAMQPPPTQGPNNQMVYAMQPPPTQGPNNQMVYAMQPQPTQGPNSQTVYAMQQQPSQELKSQIPNSSQPMPIQENGNTPSAYSTAPPAVLETNNSASATPTAPKVLADRMPMLNIQYFQTFQGVFKIVQCVSMFTVFFSRLFTKGVTSFYFCTFQFVKLMKEERGKWESEKEAEVTQLTTSMRTEMERTNAHLRDELVRERREADDAKQQMSNMRIVGILSL